MTDYLPLKPVIKHRGYTLTQLKRTKNAAIYQVRGAGLEVIKIRRAEACEIKSKDGRVNVIEARELYPSDEQFGALGWYFMPGDEVRAEKKWREIR